MKLDAKNKPYETINEVVDKLATMQKEQSKVLQIWMESFKVHEIPNATIVRDSDEFDAEQDREYQEKYGIPKSVSESVRNAAKVGAFPELKDVFSDIE